MLSDRVQKKENEQVLRYGTVNVKSLTDFCKMSFTPVDIARFYAIISM